MFKLMGRLKFGSQAKCLQLNRPMSVLPLPLTDLTLHVEDDETNEELEEEESPEDPGVGGGEAVVLAQGPAAPAHRDEEDEEAGQEEEGGDGEQAVVQEVQVLSVRQLDHNPGQHQDQPEDLKIFQ